MKLFVSSHKRPSRLATLCIAILPPCAFILGVFLYFSWEVENRFAGSRWSIPSYIFSDNVILFQHQPLTIEKLSEMLARRLYQERRSPPSRPGEYQLREGAGEVTVWFRAFEFPGKRLPGKKLTFKIAHGALEVIRADNSNLAYWELEPVELTRLYGKEKESRLLINIARVPSYVKDAVVAIEDRRFYDHPGVDLWGIVRALWTDIRAQKIVQGGSTITQQLVKNYFLEPERTLKRKILEALIAVVIESRYSKDEILEMYLNEIYMGQRGSVEIHGFGEAARFYFGRNIEDLSLAEAATLAGMIKAPTLYNPLSHPAQSKIRRDIVLDAMEHQGKIDAHARAQAQAEPLETSGKLSIPVKQAPYFVDFVFEQLQELYTPDILAQDGLVIYTSLIPEIEEEAERSLRTMLQKIETERLSRRGEPLPSALQGVITVVQPKTGMVRALVGGRDYVTSTFNRVIHAKRQPGSAIKPFIYLAALKKGWTLASWLDDEPLNIPLGRGSWTPENYDHQYRGRVTLREALEESLNVPTVRLALQVGMEDVAAFLDTLGFTIPPMIYPSLALGALEVSPLVLTSAYAALANEGDKPYLITIKEVYNAAGELQEQHHVEWARVAAPAETFLITSALEGVVQRGTARSLASYGITFPVAGKTGTTSDYRDSWFVGYTTDIVTLVWVGTDDNRPTGLSGATGALRVWAHFMKNIQHILNAQPFSPPEGIVVRTLCQSSEALATVSCPSIYEEYFIEGSEPSSSCPLHGEKSFELHQGDTIH